MREIIMVGCDLHDKTMLLKVAQGRRAAEQLTFPNTPPGRQALIARLQERSRSADGAQVAFAYEASGQGFARGGAGASGLPADRDQESQAEEGRRGGRHASAGDPHVARR